MVLVERVIKLQEETNCQTRSILKNIETNEEMEKRELKCVEKSQLSNLCTKVGANSCGRKQELWVRAREALIAERISKNKDSVTMLQMYAFIKVFASNCLFFMQSIRTNDFDLRLGILKKSLKLFKEAGADYYTLVFNHLLDFHYFFTPAQQQFMREVCFIKCKTKNSYKTLDEIIENTNLDLKNSVHKVTTSVIKEVSSFLSVQRELEGVFKKIFGDHSHAFGRSRTIKYDNISVLDENFKLSDVKNYNLSTILGWCNNLTEEEKKFSIEKGLSEVDVKWIDPNK